MASHPNHPRSAAIFGASGAIGRALCERLAALGCEQIHAGSRSGVEIGVPGSVPFAFDLTDESSIAAAAQQMAGKPPEWVVIASGVLSLAEGRGPERTLKRIDADAMARVLALNTIGPALIAKHVLPLMPRERSFVFAALGARVGSISDNQLGGWHSYRASKAALNMLVRNFAIEMGRTHEHGVVVALHPGTVDSRLSKPFQKGLAEGQLTEPDDAAKRLVDVMASLAPGDSGKVFDYAGAEIPA
ncbi:SDR family NAD(P)-dependent oxidoreductase [Qipengyuania nanhaisediminis]|uniref:SDR family NAD(P)-dependent oxidoreductase n=1 Tax=Qipengyuania nanhaisediminis TaxID=604088 RepID=UPI0038B40873